jgi:hypothetical protein
LYFELGGHLGWKSGSTDTIWKGAIQESFQQSLVGIGPVVSEEKNFFKFHPPFIAYITEFFMNFELLPILTDYAN